ncbi:hypothetical protein J2S98_003840 [Arthrobacter oryzae]|uniref:hypothetical protein n=1 Tax=Arthrobacter oryzae TaxID=409290 RepID=UPI002785A2CF|nr:hypothetical protein [Arthrobacter oryzae]MDP9988652.1 hypothetical protein [Arthrobacter oryzae]
MNLHDLQARATERLDAERAAKIESITALAGAAEKVESSRAELAEAERQHTAAYSKALRLGWTDADLKDFGITQPGKKPTGRPRGPKKATQKPTEEQSQESSQQPA